MYKELSSNHYVGGVKLTFSDEFYGAAASSTTLGTATGPSGSYPLKSGDILTPEITQVYICSSPLNNLRTLGVFFKYADGTTLKSPDPNLYACCDYSDCGTSSYYIPSSGTLPGQLRGFSFNRATCNGGLDFCIDTASWSIFYDADSCSVTNIPTFTLPAMTILVGGAPQTQSINSSLFTNSVATAQANAAYCGTGYTVIHSPAKSFLSYFNGVFTGSSSSYIDVGSYFITVKI